MASKTRRHLSDLVYSASTAAVDAKGGISQDLPIGSNLAHRKGPTIGKGGQLRSDWGRRDPLCSPEHLGICRAGGLAAKRQGLEMHTSLPG